MAWCRWIAQLTCGCGWRWSSASHHLYLLPADPTGKSCDHQPHGSDPSVLSTVAVVVVFLFVLFCFCDYHFPSHLHPPVLPVLHFQNFSRSQPPNWTLREDRFHSHTLNYWWSVPPLVSPEGLCWGMLGENRGSVCNSTACTTGDHTEAHLHLLTSTPGLSLQRPPEDRRSQAHQINSSEIITLLYLSA